MPVLLRAASWATSFIPSRNKLPHAPHPVQFPQIRSASASLDLSGPMMRALTRLLLPSLHSILTSAILFVEILLCPNVCVRACIYNLPHFIRYETWFYWTGIDQWSEFVVKKFADVPFPDHLKGHSTHPVRSVRACCKFKRCCARVVCSYCHDMRDSRSQFCWLEQGQEQKVTPIGGRGLWFLPPLDSIPLAFFISSLR